MATSAVSYYRRAWGYAQDVVNERIPACKWTKLACQRFIDDRAYSRSPNYFYAMDIELAARACRFIERMPLTKGDGATQKLKLILQPWQAFIVVNLFGWISRETGARRFRESYVKVPRKNGKSELAAAIALYLMAGDGEIGAEVFCGGWGEAQSRKVFNAAAQMVRLEKRLQDKLGIEIWGSKRNPETITKLRANAKMVPLVAKPGDGDNPHGYICDEYHEHKTDEQYDTMKTGMVARSQSLIFIITTAGSSIGGPCYTYEDDAKKELEAGTIADRLFICCWEIDEDDDWKSDEAIRKANPNLDVSVNFSDLAATRDTAVQRQNKRNIYKAKHLNQWVGAEAGYFDTEAWLKAGRRKVLTWEDIKGRRCWFGLDLAEKTDFCALVIWSPRDDGSGFDIWSKFWLPDQTVQNTPEGHRYRRYAELAENIAKAGEAETPVEITQGSMVDFDHVEEDIWRIWSMVDGVDLAFDPAHAAGLIPRLMKRGIPCVDYGASAKNFSDPMQLLDGYIRQGVVAHDNNPVMNWMMSNVVNVSRRLDLVYPGRNVRENKIDGPVALIMPIGRQVYAPDKPSLELYRIR